MINIEWAHIALFFAFFLIGIMVGWITVITGLFNFEIPQR